MIAKRAVLVTAFLLLAPLGAWAQAGVCGDVDSDGLVTVADIVFLTHYLFDNGPAPDSLWTADVDGVAGITVNDLQVLSYLPMIPDLSLTCTPLLEHFALSLNDTTKFLNTTVPPSFGFNVFRYVELWHVTDCPGGAVANGLTGFSLPFSYSCTTTDITLDTIIAHVDQSIVRTAIDSVNQRALFAFSRFPTNDNSLGGEIHLATLAFRLAELDINNPTYILIDTVSDALSHTTVAVENYLEPSVPAMLGLLGSDPGPTSCCDGETGDVNMDGNVTLTDLTQLLNRLFITFEPLACPAEGNINGDPDCVISLTDLTLLVEDIFICFGCGKAFCNSFDNSICR